MKYFYVGLGLLIVVAFTLLKGNYVTMASHETGVVFAKLPPLDLLSFSIGGVRSKLIGPGESEVVLPWDEVYRLTTNVQSVSFGNPDDRDNEPYIQTRSLDGNEVGLSLTIQYNVVPQHVGQVIQRVGYTDSAVRSLVSVTARSYIRSFFNILQTMQFREADKRDTVLTRLKEALNDRLNPEGIQIIAVIYRDHRFERVRSNGEIDSSYQELIDKTQETNQRIETEIQRRASELEVRRREVAEAEGVTRAYSKQREGLIAQYRIRGEAIVEAKKNEAEEIRQRGFAEVEGLRKKVDALQGPGGRAQLKLELARELAKNQGKFVVVDSQSGNSLRLDHLDANQLLKSVLGDKEIRPAKTPQSVGEAMTPVP